MNAAAISTPSTKLWNAVADQDHQPAPPVVGAVGVMVVALRTRRRGSAATAPASRARRRRGFRASTVADTACRFSALPSACGSTSRNDAPSSAPIAKLTSTLTHCGRAANETAAAADDRQQTADDARSQDVAERSHQFSAGFTSRSTPGSRSGRSPARADTSRTAPFGVGAVTAAVDGGHPRRVPAAAARA